MELRAKDAPKFIARPTTDCAQCGALLFSSWTEHVAAHRVRDLWECYACGYTFETESVFPEMTRLSA
jgi:hypothetical protein